MPSGSPTRRTVALCGCSLAGRSSGTSARARACSHACSAVPTAARCSSVRHRTSTGSPAARPERGGCCRCASRSRTAAGRSSRADPAGCCSRLVCVQPGTGAPSTDETPPEDVAGTGRPLSACLVRLLRHSQLSLRCAMAGLRVRDVPDDVVAALDARESRLGLSRNAYLLRKLAPEALTTAGPTTADDLRRHEEMFADMSGPGVTARRAVTGRLVEAVPEREWARRRRTRLGRTRPRTGLCRRAERPRVSSPTAAQGLRTHDLPRAGAGRRHHRPQSGTADVRPTERSASTAGDVAGSAPGKRKR
jgi:hypothetical protein